MKLKIKTTKILSTALAFTLGMTLIPWLQSGTAVRADGTKNKDNTKLGVSQISDPSVPDSMESEWSGSYIYFGNYEGTPIRFRVLDKDSDIYGNGKKTVFLDCDTILFESAVCIDAPDGLDLLGPSRYPALYSASDSIKKYVEEYSWENSDLKKLLNGPDFLENRNIFTEAEESSIANSYVSSHDLVMGTAPGNVDYDAYENFEGSEGLTGEKIFVLDVEDILNDSYGYYLPKNPTINHGDVPSHDTSGINADDSPNRIKTYNGSVKGYWLRSCYNGLGVMGDVWTTGYLYCDSIFNPFLGVSPALNLDQELILFSTVISGTSGDIGAEYKLTFIDPNFELALPSSASYSGNTITVPFSITGKDPSEVSQISVLITDKAYNDNDAKILYYDSLNVTGNISSSGTGTFVLPEGLGNLGSDYHLYVFAEDINGDHESDYASTPSEILSIIPASDAGTDDGQNTPINPAPNGQGNNSFESFVERLYEVALGRASESEGKAFWTDHVKNGDLTGADCAREFLNSAEFNSRNLTDEEFLSVLYNVFFDRNAEDDPSGLNYWLTILETESRSSVVEGFIDSTEWCNVCASYGVRSGAATAKATKASDNATAFATRLYTECLGREPEQEGLNFWSLALTNLEVTGTKAAREFFYSREFQDSNYDNEEYITRLYETFMGREPDNDGLAFWVSLLEGGTTRNDVFDSFAKSNEFAEICNSYAIQR